MYYIINATEYINENIPDVIIRYSTVGEFLSALHESSAAGNVKFPVVKHDFVPYADNEDSYWTGYYTTLPNLKKIIRQGEAALRSAETAMVFARAFADQPLTSAARASSSFTRTKVDWVDVNNRIQRAREDVGVMQHHDAITGTCRKHVATDYMKISQAAIDDSHKVEKQMIQIILEHNGSDRVHLEDVSKSETLDQEREFDVVVHSSTSNRRIEIITLRIKSSSVAVTDADGRQIPHQVIPVISSETPLFDVSFPADMSGFSVRKYTIQPKRTDDTNGKGRHVLLSEKVHVPKHLHQFVETRTEIRDIPSLDNEAYSLELDKRTGYIASVLDKRSNQRHRHSNQFLEYVTSRSGSYIFRPNKLATSIRNDLDSIFISTGPLFNMAVVKTTRFTYTVRLFHAPLDGEFIELRFHLNALPINTELVTRLGVSSAGPQTQGQLITFDGYTFMKRKVHEEAPKAGQFYPAVAGALYSFPNTFLTVLTEHTMAMTTSPDGLEFMIHRRLGKDDGRGMAQANNDDSEFSFRMLISYGPHDRKGAPNWTRIHHTSHALNNPLTTYIAATKRIDNTVQDFTPIAQGTFHQLSSSSHTKISWTPH